jgi:predicted lipoprotein with Yx(FWY)xxD motif
MSMRMKHLLPLAALACAAALPSAAPAAKKPPTITLKSRTATSVGKVLAAPNAHTLYRLTGETRTHLLCKSSFCLSIWKPLLVRSKTTKVVLPTGVHGTIGFVKRGTKYQVSLSSHLLYTYVSDSMSGEANGQRIRSFGGTWLVIPVKTNSTTPAPNPSPQPGPTYPPYY